MGRKIITGFILAIMSLVVIGYFTYLSLTRLVTALHNEANPDVRLLKLQELVVNISEAENAVQAFTINHDNDELSAFYETPITVDSKIMSLKASTEDSLQSIWLDSLDLLIVEKFRTLNQLVELTRDQQSDQVLERVKEKIVRLEEEKIKKSTDTSSLQPPQRKSILQRLFGGSDDSEETEDKLQQGEKITQELTEAVQSMQEEHAQTQQLLTSAELELFNQNKDISERIQYFINKFEEQERELSAERAALADKINQQTINKITIIGAITIFTIIALLLVILHDIRVNKRTKLRLQAEKKRAEKLAKAKQEFLSNISHEIRTPMNSIIGFAEQLDNNEFSSVQNKYLKAIRSSSEHLLVIINDLLDYSKMDASKFKLASVGFRPHETIMEVYESLKPDADSKIDFTCNIADDLPEILIGDPVRLRQILINLVNNALKFTQEGKVEIQCEAENREMESTLIVKVVDTGIGIPQKQLKKIFGSFNQASNTSIKKTGGTGLGLAICKKLVTLHKGSLDVESTEGEGSIFKFTLPYKIGTANDLPDEKHRQVSGKDAFKGKRILIADDENYNLILLKTILEKWGMEVHTVEDGDKAIRMAKDNDYDLILMDLQMPKMGGKEAVQLIRKELNLDVNIIALTADYSTENARKCLDIGMNDYIIKPIKERDLFQMLSQSFPSEQESHENVDKKVKHKPDKSEYDLSDLKELSAGDPQFVIKMIKLFIKNTSSGLKDIREAVSEKDHESVALKAHKIVAPCRHLGLSEIVNKLKEIERIAESKDFDKINALISEVERDMDNLIPVFERELRDLETKQRSLNSEING